MMNWYGGGMGGGGALFLWLFMIVFWVALIALVVFLVVKLLPGSTKPTASGPAVPPTTGMPVESPEQVLDRMFAVGEIDEATYRARRTALAEMRKSS